MRRFNDWPTRLVSYIESRAAEPFAWGTNDCVTFAAGAVRAMTGIDLLDGFAWSDARGAAAGLRPLRGLAGAVASRLGVPLITTTLAQRGDIVLVQVPLAERSRRVHCAVCEGAGWVSPGLTRGPMSQAVLAWRV